MKGSDWENEFLDVQNSWYTNAVLWAKSKDIANGTPDGNFGVGKNITRQDMVVMAYRAITAMNKTVKKPNAMQNFADSASISDYAVEAVGVMQQAGVVYCIGNNSFEPLGTANRAQAAVVICNLINAME